MVTLQLTRQEASELLSLVLYEKREAERHFISDHTLREILSQIVRHEEE
jgi:hypothetical protein